MSLSTIHLAQGGELDAVRLGRRGGHPVLYFHSPASAGEELVGAAEEAAGAANIELVVIVRRSLAARDFHVGFMATVAAYTELFVEALGVASVVVLGWSGGATYALAASERLGPAVSAIHVVSPVPGPLTGPGAVPDQSARLQQIAATSKTSRWAAEPGAFRDYLAIVEPWPFEIGSIVQPVTIWAPTDDEIVPPRLVEHLARQLSRAQTISVSGGHNWIAGNWSTVLQRIATGVNPPEGRSGRTASGTHDATNAPI